MLIGDAGVEVEEELITKYRSIESVNSCFSTSPFEAFSSEVDPSNAILSYGAENQYGHPHSDVVNHRLYYAARIVYPAWVKVMFTPFYKNE